MTDLQKYQINPQHAAAVRACGFDARDPDARHPVRNPVAQKILAAQGRTPIARDPRIDALVRAKDGLMDRVRGRGLGLLLTTALASASAFPALAVPEANDVATSDLRLILDQILHGLSTLASMIPGPRDPIWTTALLTGLLTSQILPIIRTRTPMHRKPSRQSAPGAPELAKPEAKPTRAFHWHIDGASRMGEVRTENQDACRMVRISEDKCVFVLCDGAGGIAGGKLAAETAAETLAEHISAAFNQCRETDWATMFEQAVAQARGAVKAEKDAGITTAIIAVLDGDRLHFATLGDGALVVVWPDGMTQEVLAPHHILGEDSNIIAGFIGHDCDVAPRVGSLRLEPGCMVLSMSDGAGDLFPRDSFAENHKAYGVEITTAETGLADRMLRQLENARDPQTNAYLHSDNLTLLVGMLECVEANNG